MSLWESVLLGIIQGLTEFLPISSTAHLLIVREWILGHPDPRDAYTTVIQLGTLAAVVLYFRADLVRFARAFFHDLAAFRPGTTADSRMGWKIVVGTIPVVACGFAGKEFIKEHLYRPVVIGSAAIGFAVLMLTAERIGRRRTGRDESAVTWADVLLIGAFQALALIPGASRSGCTISAGLLAGLSRSASARFSFLLSLPSILGAGLYEGYKDWSKLPNAGTPMVLAVGALTAAVVGYWSIGWLMRFLRSNALYGFVAYRIVVGVVILIVCFRSA